MRDVENAFVPWARTAPDGTVMRRLLDPQGTFTYVVLRPAQRPVPLAVAARATLGVPLPAAVRPAVPRRRCSRPCSGCRTRCAPTSTWRWPRRRSCPTRTATRQRSSTRSRSSPGRTGCPGGAQRFGNTKTFGVLRAEFTVLDGPPRRTCGTACSPRRAPTRRRCGSPDPGPYAPPDLEDLGQCSVGHQGDGRAGPKLMEDESATQDLILVTPASFVTPDIRENATMQRWVRAKAPLGYLINPRPFRLLHLVDAAALLADAREPARGPVLQQRAVPARRGPGGAVLAASRRASGRSRIPVRPAENYLRDAMVQTLDRGRLGDSTSWCRCRPTRT